MRRLTTTTTMWMMVMSQKMMPLDGDYYLTSWLDSFDICLMMMMTMKMKTMTMTMRKKRRKKMAQLLWLVAIVH